jgi:hypothetical protein
MKKLPFLRQLFCCPEGMSAHLLLYVREPVQGLVQRFVLLGEMKSYDVLDIFLEE